MLVKGASVYSRRREDEAECTVGRFITLLLTLKSQYGAYNHLVRELQQGEKKFFFYNNFYRL